MNRPRRQRPGFTLVEAIAAIVIIAVLGSVGSGIIYSGVDALRRGSDQAALHAELSQALELITRIVRETPLDSGGAPTISGTSTQLTVTSIATFSVTSGSLRYANLATSSTQTIATGVTSVLFEYFDESNAAVANATPAASVRRVAVTITASRAGTTESVRTRVFLRNEMIGGGS